MAGLLRDQLKDDVAQITGAEHPRRSPAPSESATSAAKLPAIALAMPLPLLLSAEAFPAAETSEMSELFVLVLVSHNEKDHIKIYLYMSNKL
jgi:hypothetical protein